MENFYDATLGKRMQQISIRKARKLFDKNVTIYLQSSNMRFNTHFQSADPVNKKNCSSWWGFEQICNNFRYYNCDNERGKYIHFYVDEKDV